MTAEQVIRLGEKAFDVSDKVTDYSGIGFVFFTLSLFGIFLFLFVEMENAVILCVVLSISGLGVGIHSDIKVSELQEKEVEEWKEEVVKPYIESLPIEKREVVYIKIDPELSHKVEGGHYYTTSKAVERTPLTISFKENGLTTVTNWYETHMELTKEERPYVEYQKVPKNLGNGIKKGLYNVKVHLPENYEFTDIK